MKIGVDFGSYSLKIYAEGKGIVVDEPSIVAIDNQTGNPIAFGKAADNVYGRCSDDISISKVINNGVVSDFVMAERMLRYYLQRVCGNRIYKPNIILSLPSNISSVEKKTFLDVVTLTGAGRVCMVEGILASAFGCDSTKENFVRKMVIDIGHHITEYAIVSQGRITNHGTIKHGSYDIDKTIINHLRKDRDILIGPHTAREIKNKITTAKIRDCEVAMFPSGKSCLDRLPISFEITSTELYPYVSEQIDMIINEINDDIMKVSTDLLANVTDNGIMLCGGGSLIFDIAERLSEKLDIKCNVIDEPRLAKVKGLGYFINDNYFLDDNGYNFIFRDEIRDRLN
ncbi:MAG: rod shape-determining protein [Clostridia bacterium]|nr:rod shape-determining protein [Clostridia bacterium]